MAGWPVLLAPVLGAIVGYSHGLIVAVLSLLGLVIGGVIGFHIASAISGDAPGWAALGALVGAVSGARILGGTGHRARVQLRIPGLGLADGLLGAVLGAAVALVILSLTTPIITGLRQNLTAGSPSGARPGILTRLEQVLGARAAPPAAGPTGR